MKARKFLMLLYFMCCVTIFPIFSSCENGAPAYVGTWVADNVEVEPGVFIDMVMTINNDGTFEQVAYEAGTTTLTDGTVRGTYEVEGDIFTMTITEQYKNGTWQSHSQTSIVQYSISGNTMTLNVDLDEPPDGVYDLTVVVTKQG